MRKGQVMLRGTITIANPEFSDEMARRLLERIGVEVGSFDVGEREFRDCRVSDDAMCWLDDLWGRFVWVLTPEKK